MRLLVAFVVSLALGVASLYLVAPDGFDRQLLRTLGRLDARALSVIALPMVLWWILSGWRIAFLTSRTARPATLWQGMQAHILGTFSAIATPAGGGNSIGIIFLLNRFGVPANQAVAVAVMCVVGDLAFFAWAAPVAYLLLRLSRANLAIDELGALVMTVSLVALIVSYLLVYQLPLATRLLRGMTRLPLLRRFRTRADSFLYDLGVASAQFSRRPWHWHLRFHLLSSAARLPYFAVLNLALIGLGAYAEHLIVYTVQVVLHAFAFLVPTPGASGYQEAAVSYVLKGHIGRQSLAASIIVWRLYQHYIYFLAGPLVGGLAMANWRPRGKGTDA